MPIENYAKQAWQSDTVTPEIAADYASYAKNIKKNAANLGSEAQKSVSQTWYKRLAGEAEARLTQSRMDMTGAERAANYPPSMYDVPVGDQIVRYGDGPESQAIARYREIKGPKSVVRMEAALRTAGVPLPKSEPVAYIQGLVDRAHRRN
jgi:hypothetical protein